VLLANDAVCLANVGREELVQPDLHGPQPLILVQPTNVRLHVQVGNNQKGYISDCYVLVKR
jgi:hypothetical protein